MKKETLITFDYTTTRKDEKLGDVTIIMNVGIDLEDLDSYSVEESHWTETTLVEDGEPILTPKSEKSLTLVMKKTYIDYVTVSVPKIIGKSDKAKIHYDTEIQKRELPLQHTIMGEAIDVILNQIKLITTQNN